MITLEAVVQELGRSAARSSAARYFLHAILVSAGWVLAVLVAARLVPIEQSLRIAAFGVPVTLSLIHI